MQGQLSIEANGQLSIEANGQLSMNAQLIVHPEKLSMDNLPYYGQLSNVHVQWTWTCTLILYRDDVETTLGSPSEWV